ncbi:hypothetical protein PCASD_14577 [Puccinia coronata f. sp. avenae]|uniref:Uncharacterized protein n=1 Tax=Puccinia coronata f. sp. avenae TaxID=200324 RepID=A0A2N5TBI1_9BASI|nr:hypothetical protein PCASD_14577 [Puccinia coronata f. sp. avenae]
MVSKKQQPEAVPKGTRTSLRIKNKTGTTAGKSRRPEAKEARRKNKPLNKLNLASMAPIRPMLEIFCRFVILTTPKDRNRSLKEKRLADNEQIAWEETKPFSHGFISGDQDTVSTERVFILKHNLALFYVTAIEAPEKLTQEDFSPLILSLLIHALNEDRATKIILIRQCLSFVVELEAYQFILNTNQPDSLDLSDSLFGESGQSQKSLADYPLSQECRALLGESLSDLFDEICSQVTKDIASSLGDLNRSSERFSVSKLICICVAVLQQLYSTVSKPKTTATNSPTSKEIPRRVSTAEEAPSDISDSSDDTEGSDDFQEDALRARVSIGASEHPASSSDHQIKSLADVAKRVFQMVPEGGQAPGSSLGERLHQPVEPGIRGQGTISKRLLDAIKPIPTKQQSYVLPSSIALPLQADRPPTRSVSKPPTTVPAQRENPKAKASFRFNAPQADASQIPFESIQTHPDSSAGNTSRESLNERVEPSNKVARSSQDIREANEDDVESTSHFRFNVTQEDASQIPFESMPPHTDPPAGDTNTQLNEPAESSKSLGQSTQETQETQESNEDSFLEQVLIPPDSHSAHPDTISETAEPSGQATLTQESNQGPALMGSSVRQADERALPNDGHPKSQSIAESDVPSCGRKNAVGESAGPRDQDEDTQPGTREVLEDANRADSLAGPNLSSDQHDLQGPSDAQEANHEMNRVDSSAGRNLPSEHDELGTSDAQEAVEGTNHIDSLAGRNLASENDELHVTSDAQEAVESTDRVDSLAGRNLTSERDELATSDIPEVNRDTDHTDSRAGRHLASDRDEVLVTSQTQDANKDTDHADSLAGRNLTSERDELATSQTQEVNQEPDHADSLAGPNSSPDRANRRDRLNGETLRDVPTQGSDLPSTHGRSASRAKSVRPSQDRQRDIDASQESQRSDEARRSPGDIETDELHIRKSVRGDSYDPQDRPVRSDFAASQEHPVSHDSHNPRRHAAAGKSRQTDHSASKRPVKRPQAPGPPLRGKKAVEHQDSRSHRRPRPHQNQSDHSGAEEQAERSSSKRKDSRKRPRASPEEHAREERHTERSSSKRKNSNKRPRTSPPSKQPSRKKPASWKDNYEFPCDEEDQLEESEAEVAVMQPSSSKQKLSKKTGNKTASPELALTVARGDESEYSDEESRKQRTKKSRGEFRSHESIPPHKRKRGASPSDDESSSGSMITIPLSQPRSRQQSVSHSQTGPRKRTFWSLDEEKLLVKEVVKWHHNPNCMAQIIKRHGPNGSHSKTFAHRTGVDLKDKAVNLTSRWYREGSKVKRKVVEAFSRFPPKVKYLPALSESEASSSGSEASSSGSEASSSGSEASSHSEATDEESRGRRSSSGGDARALTRRREKSISRLQLSWHDSERPSSSARRRLRTGDPLSQGSRPPEPVGKAKDQERGPPTSQSSLPS